MGAPTAQDWLAQKNDQALGQSGGQPPPPTVAGPRGNQLQRGPDGNSYRTVVTEEDRQALPPTDQYYYHNGKIYPNPNYNPNYRNTGRMGEYGMPY
jgi:hypothetical protein